MAVLWITEYRRIAFDAIGSSMPVGIEPSTTQTVAISGSNAVSVPLSADTRFVRLHTDTPCYVLFGASNPVATSSAMRLAGNQTEFFGLMGGPAMSIAVLQGV